MKLKPAINSTIYAKSNQYFFSAFLPSCTNALAACGFFSLRRFCSWYALVSGRQSRNNIIRTGGPAPNQYSYRKTSAMCIARWKIGLTYRSPTMPYCIHECSRKYSSKQVSKGITLLQHSRHNAPSCFGAVFDGCIRMTAPSSRLEPRTGLNLPVAAAFPYNPPIAIPKSALTAKNRRNVCTKLIPSSRHMNIKIFIMNGHFRPYRSLAIPKRIAPILRSISTRVIAQVISDLLRPKVVASSGRMSVTVKKSKESQVQPRKATRKKSHCWVLRRLRRWNGLGIQVRGGVRLVKRVIR